MPLRFRDDLSIEPLPVDERAAVTLARNFQAVIVTAGSRERAASEAVDRIFALTADHLPSEHRRLQLLYRLFYTRAELERLTLRSFDALGMQE